MRPRDFLNTIVTVKIDRPLGSRHPQHGFIYPVNYGYVPDTPAPDGDDLDAYVLGVFEPIEEFTGRCIAVVHRLDDDDDKLIVVPDDRQFSDEQIQALVEFQERFFTSIIQRTTSTQARNTSPQQGDYDEYSSDSTPDDIRGTGLSIHDPAPRHGITESWAICLNSSKCSHE